MEVNFESFERMLAATRDVQKLTYAWFAEHGLNHKTVYSIEHGGNYRFSSLFRFVNLLGCKLMLNNEVVWEYGEIGPLLMSLRERYYINRVEMSKMSGISMKALNTMEHGGDFTRSTLAKYGRRFRIFLTLVIPHDKPDPFDSKIFIKPSKISAS